MKIFNQTICRSTLLLFMLLTSCGPVLNPYNEDFKCRKRDDAGECIDTPTAYKKARYPETATQEKAEPTNGLKQEIKDNRYKVLAELLQEEKKVPKMLASDTLQTGISVSASLPQVRHNSSLSDSNPQRGQTAIGGVLSVMILSIPVMVSISGQKGHHVSI